MTTEAIELICEKLGTTVESIVPAVIAYAKHSLYVQFSYSIPILVVGIILIIITATMLKTDRSRDFFDLPFGLTLGGIALPFVGVMWTLVNIYYLHMWNAFPTIKAYETILHWIGGGQ